MQRARRASTVARTQAANREARAQVILQQDRARAESQFEPMRGRGRLLVPSQQYANNGVKYRVRFNPDTLQVTSGTCPDEHYRRPQGGCKHMRAAKIWLRRHRLRL